MPQFAMFFADGAGFGIERVQSLNAANARTLPAHQHPLGMVTSESNTRSQAQP